jgi:hypothetical protein
MSSYISLGSGRSSFAPSIDEVIDYADQQIDKLANEELHPDVPNVRGWYEAETDYRYARFVERRDAPVDVAGGPLIVGEWYDVTQKIGFGYSRSRGETRTWRICRYRGRAGDVLFFERFGAKAATDPYMRATNDSVMISKLASVTKLEPDPRILAKLDEQRRKDEERNAAIEQRRRDREEATT